MSAPRYRTLDGEEVELPLAMNQWVLVPRALARFDPELAWALDYEDAPEPEDADPRLDFSAGALLVPLERWNEHAELEPNLAPCYSLEFSPPRLPLGPPGEDRIDASCAVDGDGSRFAMSLARAVGRVVTIAIAALAVAYAIAVGAWLWTLRDGITGSKVSTGVMLLGVAVLLAWLAGIARSEWPPASRALVARRRWPQWGAAVLTDHPLGILRIGLTAQVFGFAVLVALR
jgi:hypothetical protein